MVSGLSSGVAEIAAGEYHTCALLTSGQVKCWGLNAYGNLGDTTVVDSNVPVTVSGVSGLTTIKANGGHTCGLTSSNNMICWGLNSKGQIGNNSLTDAFSGSVPSGLPSRLLGLSLGANQTCAQTDSGKVACWGINSHGQLGDGTTTDNLMPGTISP
jgi:alpha-tubulin suppressor-like RCC1 family protein